MFAPFTRRCSDLTHYLGTFKSELMEFWTVLKDKRTWCFFQFVCIVAESKETEFGAETSEATEE